ncbi:hypothetical protein ACFL5A_05105 [Gemmatimonadota bacterium]
MASVPFNVGPGVFVAGGLILLAMGRVELGLMFVLAPVLTGMGVMAWDRLVGHASGKLLEDPDTFEDDEDEKDLEEVQ